jgi:single-stranded-DNA-specific exonuclease
LSTKNKIKLQKSWKLKNLFPDSNNDPLELGEFVQQIRNLKSNVQLPDLVIRILYSRGIKDYAQLLKFFKPSVKKLYDPFLLKDIDIATERILSSIINGEKIMILGDYDVDGTCGVSMFYLFLKHFKLDPQIYIPDRFNEGYGISVKAIDHAKELGIKLIVSIDCGITAGDKIDYAKTLGIEFIICDHHQVQDNIPNALAVINPLRKDCNYPFKFLCGTGVAFKLVQSVSIKLEEPEFPATLLDFVAIATASDIVPVIDENRIIIKEGLDLINNNPRYSIKSLIESCGYKIGNINTGNIVFGIAPRINSVGRLGDAKRAVDLLTNCENEKAGNFTDILNLVNIDRREIDKSNTEDACKIFEQESENTNCIVLHNDKWHPGVVGIVAARMVEKYNIPCIILTTVNGVAKGSARSIKGFNIFEALKNCEDLLIQFGGHFHAAGLEIELDKISEFKKRINDVAKKTIKEEYKIPEIECEAEIEFKDITEQFVKILTFFEPFGPSNITPAFVTRNVTICGEVRFVKNNTHIFRVKDESTVRIFDAVFFNSLAYKDILKAGIKCDICFHLEKNEWNGVSKIKLRVKDIKFKNYN